MKKGYFLLFVIPLLFFSCETVPKNIKLFSLPEYEAESLKFYEGERKGTGRQYRVYKYSFDAKTTKHVNYELRLSHHDMLERKFKVHVKYYYSDGKVKGEWSRKAFRKKEWDTSVHWGSWGNETPGWWKPDIYKVEIKIDNDLIAVGTFEIKDKTINEYSEDIKENSKNPEDYFERGKAYNRIKNFKNAINDLTKAIEINPSYGEAYYYRAVIYRKQLMCEKAISDYEKMIKLMPENAWGFYGLAWTLAACPEKSFRDGDRALNLSLKAAKIINNKENEHILNTTACAYAEIGDWDNAIKYQQRLLYYLKKTGIYFRIKKYEKRLNDFKQKIPYRLTKKDQED